jgi:DNA uptake protein ComE-like DNA-binding protein
MNRTRRIILTISFGLLCLALFAGPVLAAESEEVAERLELNTATVEQIVALGVLTPDEAQKIVNFRDQYGDLQSYDDLKEAGIPEEKINLLKPKTTVNHMASDCTC